MAEGALRAQNGPRKPLIFPEFFDQMAIKPTDFGHNSHPYIKSEKSHGNLQKQTKPADITESLSICQGDQI